MPDATWTIEGFAIVSADDRIADAEGRMPRSLMNDADWARFQAELDASAVTVLGRLGHEAHGNPRGRLRMIVSSAVAGLERREDGWWWNPAGIPWPDAIATVAPGGGRVAVPGGQQVFDLFLRIGYDAFHLTRAHPVRLPRGRGLFRAVESGRPAEDILGGHGLSPVDGIDVDPAAGVRLVTWRRGPGGS